MGVTTPGNKPKFEGVREVLKDPNWWMRDVFTALVVAVVVSAGAIMGQKLVDDDRSDREGRPPPRRTAKTGRSKTCASSARGPRLSRTGSGRSQTSISRARTSSGSTWPARTSPTPISPARSWSEPT